MFISHPLVHSIRAAAASYLYANRNMNSFTSSKFRTVTFHYINVVFQTSFFAMKSVTKYLIKSMLPFVPIEIFHTET